MSETTYYKYISNGAHYTDVIAKIANVKHHLWIGTADIKDLYVKSSSMTVPFLKVISRLIERGVEVRLIMPRSLALISARTLMIIRFLPNDWRESCAQGYISRWSSLTWRLPMLGQPTSQVQASA